MKTPKSNHHVIFIFFPPLRDKDRRYLFAQFFAKDVKHETWLCERTGGAMMEPKQAESRRKGHAGPLLLGAVSYHSKGLGVYQIPSNVSIQSTARLASRLLHETWVQNTPSITRPWRGLCKPPSQSRS